MFFVGAVFGSFISVIANRYNTGLSFFKGRSICFSCGEQLKKMDLIPVFSFMFLKGKCKNCGSKIPKNLFVTEIIMGVLSVVSAFKSGLLIVNFSIFPYLNISLFQSSYFSFLLVANYFIILFIFSTLLLITLYDLKHFIIPDSFLVVLFSLSFFYNLYFVIDNSFFYLVTNFMSGVIIALPFFILFLISKGSWIGFGDIKYMVAIGFLLGIVQGISAVVLAFWIGAVFSIVLIFLRKILPFVNLPIVKNNLTIKSEIPFGPFLSLGVILSFLLNLDLFHLNEIFNLF